MCGICGAFTFSNQGFTVTEPYITRMRDTMIHRGPDGGQTWIDADQCIGLGFRRLAIIDLSELAMQPMSNEDGSLWIVFNGEIYNYAEVRSELETLGGHQWKTDHSDTEVILHAFEQWGIDCIQRFRGMFAFALWDVKRRELWLIRDRIGIKPLYYSIHHGRIAFASEIKALLQDPQQNREVNEEAFFHYLSFLTTPAPQTLFEGIKKLPGGTWLRVTASGEVHEHRYWDVWENCISMKDLSEDEIAIRLLDELRTAVRLRKISDVPVGIFLSGGIDSSTNAALFSEGEGGPIRTFSIGYDGSYDTYQNELHYARLMSKIVGAEHHEKLLNVDDLIDFLPRMVQLQDEPIADPVCVPVYYVSKLARDNGVIVCQVGEGADELFWGYPAWKQALRLQEWNDRLIPNVLRNIPPACIRSIGKYQSMTYERFRRASMGQPMFWGSADAFTQVQKERILSPRLRRAFACRSSWEVIQPIYQRFENGAPEKSVLNWMSYVDLNLRLPELLLMRVDKMSMGVSLEGRVPFLDHKFVELAMSIPQNIKTRNGSLKYILKKAVKGTIPDAVIHRRKQGFAVPVQEWFFDRLGGVAREELESLCAKTDFLDLGEVQQLFDRHSSDKIWYLLNFALWWKKFIAN